MLPQLEELSLGYIFAALTRLNQGAALPEALDSAALIESWAIVPAHHALFRRLIEVVSKLRTSVETAPICAHTEKLEAEKLEAEKLETRTKTAAQNLS